MALVLRADLHLPGPSWEFHPAVRSRSGKGLELVGEELMCQILREPARKDALLDLLIGNGVGLVGDGMVLATVLMKLLTLGLSVLCLLARRGF